MFSLLFQDAKQFVKSKKWIWYVGSLLVVGIVLSLLSGKEQQPPLKEMVRIGVLNEDDSMLSKMLTQGFVENETFTEYVNFYFADREEILRSFEAGELDMYLVIPKNFVEDLSNMNHVPVEIMISTRDMVVELMLRNLVESYEKYITAVEVNSVGVYQALKEAGMSREDAWEVNEKISIQMVMKVFDKGSIYEQVVVKDMSFVALIPFYVQEAIFLGVAFLALLVGVWFQKEHHAGLVRRLTVFGISTETVLLEKMLCFTALSATWIGIVSILLHKAGLNFKAETVVLIVAMAWALGAFMLFLAAMFQKLQNYLLASNMIILLGAIIGGGIIPYTYLPNSLVSVAEWLPNYRYLKTVFAIEAGKTPEHFEIMMGIIVAGGIILVFAAAGLYRLKEGRVYGNA